MNNRGFTLVEVLAVIVIVSIILGVVFNSIGSTFSVSSNEAYKIMKNNIISASYDYINECDAGIISCDFSLEDKISFPVKILQSSGYFQNLRSPIDNKRLDDCLVIEAKKENGVVVVTLVDNCY